MNAITITEAEMLRKLDRLGPAQGVSESHFILIGAMMDRAGPDLDIELLSQTMRNQLRQLHAKYKEAK
jgi:hypothetical protein